MAGDERWSLRITRRSASGGIRRLTKARVAKLIRDGGSGRYNDGDGLSLRIDGGSATWRLSFRFNGERREMSLGSARSVDLDGARQAADDAHRLIRSDKRDPP